MKFRLSSEYGVMEYVRGGKPHSGIDFAMPEGTKLRSIFDGTVEKVFSGGNIGNGVSIKTDHGNTIYGHMSEVDVHVGDKIHSGDLIGLSGNTGNSTGPHLHFGMKENGHFVDPTNYAENVSNMSGDGVNLLEMKGPLFGVFDKVRDNVIEDVSLKTKEIILGILDGMGDFLLETIGAISLVGCGVLIILKICGLDQGYKWAGVLFGINVLVKFLLGGGSGEN